MIQVNATIDMRAAEFIIMIIRDMLTRRLVEPG
ncbi:MAG: hypothetical protein K0R83_369 [Caulobacter sp.]|jgi:hypothetical protein|nr:hypothetical protein [Caulobacter sp.]